jgi:AcrR family transcriptional regulator
MANTEKYHHGNLSAALIKEGLRLIESDSPDLSLRGLARAAGVSPNAPYRHFADRNAFLGALAADGFHRFAKEIIAAADGEDAMASLRAVGYAYLAFAARQPGLYRLMLSPEGYSLDNEECRVQAERAFGALITAVRRAQTAGWKRDQDMMSQTLVFWAMLHGWATLSSDRLLPPGITEPTAADLLDAYLA